MKLGETNRLGRLGSFWYEKESIRTHAQPMSDTINVLNETLWAELFVDKVLDRKAKHPPFEVRYKEVTRIGMPIETYKTLMKNGDGVVRISRNYYTDTIPAGALSVGNNLLAYADGSIVLGTPGVTLITPGPDYYVVGIPESITPLAVVGQSGTLLRQGVDFSTLPGLLIFSEHPDILFDNGIITVHSSHLIPESIYGYSENATRKPGYHWIREFFQTDQSVSAFTRAVAVYSGLEVLDHGGVLLLKTDSGYVFDWGILEVRYAHDPLEPGVFYPKGYIVGPLKVYGDKGDWWNIAEWPDGLPIGKLVGFGDITAPYEQRSLTAVSYRGHTHPMIQLDGDSRLLEDFWRALWDGERRSGNFLCEKIGLQVGDVASTNPVDFFLRYGFGPSLIRFDISGSFLLTKKSSILRFIDENRPIGSRVILQSNDG